MRFGIIKIIVLFTVSFALLFSPYASADDTVNSFSIDEPYAPTITAAMQAQYRNIALAHLNELLRNPHNPTNGNRYATVLLVEFMDFKCPLSERMDPALQALVAENPSFRIIYKIIPIHGAVSVYAAKAALAANRQNKYIEYHKALIEAGKSLTLEQVITISKSLGMDTEKLKQDMQSPAIQQELNTNLQLYHTIGLLGTPVLFFTKYNVTNKAKNNAIIVMLGAFPKEPLQRVIDKLLV